MEEEQPPSQTVTGNYTANLQGTGNATVNVMVPTPVKQWLPPAPQILSKAFVGRRDQVAALLQEITAGKTVAITGKPTVKAFQGMGGIGKTYLALKLATELYDHFPGHTLRIDVGPSITDEASTQRPLSRLASYAFGGIAPPGPFQPEQVAAWLNETAPGPFLVIFDDIWHQTPLRLLTRALPPMAVQLVTTRFTNVALAIGATILSLDRLSPEDGLALLEDRLHCQNDGVYQPSLAALVHLLGGHALALEIAAAQVKRLPRLATVLHELEQGIGRGTLRGLTLPPSDERDENLERSFALSYERMPPEQQRFFRTLGVFAEEAVIPTDVVAHLWEMDDLGAARRVLFDLTDLALLTEMEAPSPTVDAFRLHGLLRVYAQALLEKHDELTSAKSTHAHLFTDLSWQAVTSSPQNYERLDLHTPDLLAALDWSSKHDRALFPRLLEALSQFLLLRGQSVLLEAYLPQALAAANDGEDWRRSANLLRSLGDLERRLGNLDAARSHYDAALPLYRSERSRLGEANLLKSLGDLESRLGNVDQARSHYDAALPLYRSERDRLGEAGISMSLGDMLIAQMLWAEARTFYEQAHLLYMAEREPLGLAYTLIDLGRARFELGDHAQGLNDVQQAATLFRHVQSVEWADRAEQRLAEMQQRLQKQDPEE